uniref:Uncharacterized protein n=1 Tax=Chenopodium quinoa TaxID=63459 RepID=A0A803M7A7_CHEQI
MEVVHWYSVVSVVVVVTAAVGSVYVLWRKNHDHTQPRAAGIGTSDSLLFNTKNNPSSSESSDHYWSSCWSGLHPAYLVVFRLLSLSALAFFLAWDIHHWGPSIFIYYTEWTYSLTMMYFAIGTVISAHGCWLLHKHNNNDTPCLQESPGRGRVDLEDIPTTTSNLNYGKQQTPGFWGYLMQITYQISGGAVILTDIIFWCIIAPASSNTRLGLTLVAISFSKAVNTSGSSLIGTIISAQGCFMSAEKGPATSAGKDKFLKNDSDGNESAAALGSNKGEGSNTLQNHDSNDEAGGVGFLGSLMLIVYQISAGASMLTDLVFWCILVPMMAGKQFELTLLIGFIHSLNAVFLVIDSLLNALPFQWFGFTYFILWSVTYITFQWILHACGFTWWPYPFLELSTPWAPLWYLGMAVIHVPCYAVYIMLVKAKNSIFSKLFPRAFVRSHQWISHHQKAA